MGKQFFIIAPVLLCVFILGACTANEKNKKDVNSITPEKGFVIKEATMFTSLKLRVIKRYPYVVIAADISGNLPDSCTSVKEIGQTLKDNMIFIKIITQRPKDIMCAQALIPFKKTIKIDTSRLKKGKYTVIAGNLKAEFETGLATD